MSRRPDLIPPVKLTTTLPLDVHTQLTAHLYSELEGRVPHGGYQGFFIERIKEFFGQKTLDLSPYTGLAAGLFVVRGDPVTIEILRTHLEKAP